MSKVDEILDFWFGGEKKKDYGKNCDIWFNKNLKFDREIKTRFIETYEKAIAGELNHWNNG